MTTRIQQVIDSVDGGVSESIDELVEKVLGVSLETLTKKETDEIDEAIFTCESCGWTMPLDEQSESGDGLCRECEDD